MKKKIFGCFLLACMFWIDVSGQETFKVMFYNLLNYPLEDAVPNREDDLEFILSDYQPDLFLFWLSTILPVNNAEPVAEPVTAFKASISLLYASIKDTL